MKIHPSNALSGNLCLSVQLSAWTLHHQCFQINCFISLSVSLDIHLSSLPPHFQSISHFIVRICIRVTPPVLKNTIKNLTSDLQWNISSALSEVADLFHHWEKVHYFHWHFKSDIYDTHLFWFMQPFCLLQMTGLKKSQAWARVWECVHVCASEYTNYEVYDLTDCWTTGVIVTVGWTCSLSHSQAVFCGLNGSPDSFI